MRRLFAFLLTFVILIPVLGVTAVHATPAVSARCGILMDAATGRVLWQKNPNEQALIASTTKIMTGLLIAENCDLESRVAVPDEAVGIEGSSVYLKKGEVLTVQELLYGMMLHSGNDAAAALAIYCCGNMDDFVRKMNEKAEKLDLKNTRFSNPHGLDDEDNFSTARDLAVLACHAMHNPVFAKVVSSRTASFENRTFTNHNKLLWRYHGAMGVKTGYTKAAGRILVSCAEREGRRLVAVTISAPNDWQDHCRMLDFGFSGFESKTVLTSGDVLAEVPVLCGAELSAQVVLRENLVYPVQKDERITYRLDIPVFVFAPVMCGDEAGRLVLLVDGEVCMTVPLYWRYSVMEGA